MKLFPYILIFFSLLSCSEQKAKVYFVQLNDVYEIAPLGGGLYGGMARVAHVVDSLKALNPNTYLFMSGDFLNPSLLGNLKYEGERIKGRQMIEVMNAMNFTMVTFGNHEFDLSYDDFQKRLDESTFDWVNTNCYHQTDQGINPFAKEKSTPTEEEIPEIKKLSIADESGQTLDIGFFGVTIPSNPKPYVYYADMYQQAKYGVDSLKQMGVDVIVGLTHVNIEMDEVIAQENPDIDLILGGHEHNNMYVPQGRTLITKSDANAKQIYIHELVYDFKLDSLMITSELRPINEYTPENPEVAEIVARWDKVLHQAVRRVAESPNTVVHYTEEAWDGRDAQSRSTQTNLGQVITRAMAHSFDPPLEGAFVNGGSIRIDDFLQGEITPIDFFRVLPFGDGILKVQMTGALLNQVLTYGQKQKGDGAYLQRYGLHPIENDQWRIGDAPIEPQQLYWVATSEFLLKGYDIPFLTPNNPGIIRVIYPEQGHVTADIRQSIIQFLKNEKIN
jgi:5'-nucleotidase/UDP-sugar diphosphatase